MTDQTRPMDAERLADIRQRAEAAQPAPWVYCEDPSKTVTFDKDGSGYANVSLLHIRVDGATSADQADNTGRFIAHARQDIPDLLAEVARLRAVIEEVRAFEMQFTEMKMPEIRALDAILDRGLKGAGE